MNCGEEVILTSKNKDFVQRVVLRLYVIMNSDGPKALEINFDTLQIERIENRTINVERAERTFMNSGQIVGNVVNNV